MFSLISFTLCPHTCLLCWRHRTGRHCFFLSFHHDDVIPEKHFTGILFSIVFKRQFFFSPSLSCHFICMSLIIFQSLLHCTTRHTLIKKNYFIYFFFFFFILFFFFFHFFFHFIYLFHFIFFILFYFSISFYFYLFYFFILFYFSISFYFSIAFSIFPMKPHRFEQPKNILFSSKDTNPSTPPLPASKKTHSFPDTFFIFDFSAYILALSSAPKKIFPQ